MRYLIDGYNLVHALGLLRGKVPSASVEVARRSLLLRLQEYHGAEARQVIVVFDASRAPPGTPARQQQQGIQILNALHQQADDLIEELLESEQLPRQLIVVSDDHRLKDAARRHHCVAMGCLDYLEHIQRPRPTSPPRSRPAEASEKPEGLSAEETQDWMQRFGFEDESGDEMSGV